MGELSRIKLSEAEAERLEKEFAQIIEYFSSISEIGGDSKQLFYVTGSKAEPRKDEVKAAKGGENDRILGNFAVKDGRLMVAPKSLG